MIDPQVIFDKLASFDDADDIAFFLEGEGIRGFVGTAKMCPLANYYNRHLADELWTSVGMRSTHILGDRYKHVCGFEHTPAMNAFLARLDFGEYPQLLLTTTQEITPCPS